MTGGSLFVKAVFGEVKTDWTTETKGQDWNASSLLDLMDHIVTAQRAQSLLAEYTDQ